MLMLWINGNQVPYQAPGELFSFQRNGVLLLALTQLVLILLLSDSRDVQSDIDHTYQS